MALCARNFFLFFFSRTTVFLAGPHAVCPFGMADWLNRLRAFMIYTVFLIKKKKKKKNKIIGSLCCIVSSASWLTRSRSLRAEDRIPAEPGIAKPVALFHHSHRIVDSSRQSSPGISRKDCYKYGKFWGVDNFSYKLIFRQIDSSVLCVSVKRYVRQGIWHQKGSVNNKNITHCLHALQQRVYCQLIQFSMNSFRFRGGTLLDNNDLEFRNHPEIDLMMDQSVQRTRNSCK